MPSPPRGPGVSRERDVPAKKGHPRQKKRHRRKNKLFHFSSSGVMFFLVGIPFSGAVLSLDFATSGVGICFAIFAVNCNFLLHCPSGELQFFAAETALP